MYTLYMILVNYFLCSARRAKNIGQQECGANHSYRGHDFPFFATSPNPWQWLHVVLSACSTSELWSCSTEDIPG